MRGQCMNHPSWNSTSSLLLAFSTGTLSYLYRSWLNINGTNSYNLPLKVRNGVCFDWYMQIHHVWALYGTGCKYGMQWMKDFDAFTYSVNCMKIYNSFYFAFILLKVYIQKLNHPFFILCVIHEYVSTWMHEIQLQIRSCMECTLFYLVLFF